MSNIENIYPLTPIQQGILFHALREPASGAYILQIVSTLDGDLNIDIFKRAWDTVVSQYAPLRTLFTWEKREQPLQLVRKQVEVPWVIENWSDYSPAEQPTRLADLLADDRQTRFIFDKAPLMRLYLLQIAPQTYQFIWSVHHILLDGWSVNLILKDVFAVYNQLIVGNIWHADSSPPFIDYVRWQKAQDISSAEKYWRKTFAGFDTPTDIKIDKPRFNEQYHQKSTQLSTELTSDIQRFIKTHQLTLTTLLEGVWALLLNRYSNQNDIVFGLTTAGRSPRLEQSARIVGLLLNTLPIRIDCSPDQDLIQWLQEIQIQTSSMLQYDYTSLTDIQHWSDIEQGHNLFDTILVVENYPHSDNLASAESPIQVRQKQHFEQSNYPLAVIAIPHTELELLFIYDGQYFSDETIAQLMVHFETLLNNILSQPSQAIGMVDILTPHEQQTMLVDWNNTDIEYPKTQCIHQLIEACAARTLDSIAVVYQDGQLTYQELNHRSNQLAHALIAEGITAGQPVLLCIERSLEMIVSILAVLKAGGAYVPIDPEYPQERIQYIAQDIAVASGDTPVIITQASVNIAHIIDARHILLDADSAKIDQYPITNPDIPLSAQDRAYIIYTSGSTGQPKGVEITHQQLVHSTTARQQIYDEPLESFLLLTSYAFDSSMVGIFWTLTTSAMLVVTAHRQEQDIEALADIISTYNISHLLCLPSLYQLILAYAESQQLVSLRCVIVAGEACPASLAALHDTRLPDTNLYNEYGPTEGTVWSTVYQLPVIDASVPIPIGRPIPNMRAYILDSALRPVPMGVAGELFIAGSGIANGYFNRPELTKERFLWHQFNGRKTPERLYRTGDRARYLPDGNIQFLGRVDQQVKLRGYRVELGEIESAITQHPSISEAAVMTHTPSLLQDDIDGLLQQLQSLDLDTIESLLTEIENSQSESA